MSAADVDRAWQRSFWLWIAQVRHARARARRGSHAASWSALLRGVWQD